MCSNKTRMYSLGVVLLGLLAFSSVRAALGQEPIANTVASPAMTSFANGEKVRIRGTVVSVENCQLTVCGECGAQTVVLIGEDTSVRVDRRRASLSNVCPGSCVKVEGRGNCAGQLVAEEIKAKSPGCNTCENTCQPACAPPPPPACPPPCPPPNPCCPH
jgi:hypothetical protein